MDPKSDGRARAIFCYLGYGHLAGFLQNVREVSHSIKYSNFLSSSVAVSFSVRSLLYGIC